MYCVWKIEYGILATIYVITSDSSWDKCSAENSAWEPQNLWYSHSASRILNQSIQLCNRYTKCTWLPATCPELYQTHRPVVRTMWIIYKILKIKMHETEKQKINLIYNHNFSIKVWFFILQENIITLRASKSELQTTKQDSTLPPGKAYLILPTLI